VALDPKNHSRRLELSRSSIVGFFSKQDPIHTSTPSRIGARLPRALVEAEDVTGFLTQDLSSAISSGMGREVDTSPRLEAVESPYSKLRSGHGYVSLRELAVAANWRNSLTAPSAPLFEIAHIENAIKLAAGERSRHVRLAHGRTGGVAQVRIDFGAFF
jgi:hypothetical protein